MQIKHIIYDYTLLLKIAGIDFNTRYWNQLDGKGIESIVEVPRKYRCNTDSMLEFETVRHVMDKKSWPIWLSNVFTMESHIHKILKCKVDTEMVASLWPPEDVKEVITKYDDEKCVTEVLDKVYNAFDNDKCAIDIFPNSHELSKYVGQWIRPWKYAAQNGYALGYHVG